MSDKQLMILIEFFEELLEKTKADTTEKFDVCKKAKIDAWAIKNVLWALQDERKAREERQ